MIKICKCDDFCEMNPLFPFHSQRTVDGEDRESGLPVNLNKHLITHRRTDFKVWWPQDPAIHVLWSTAGFPGRGWGHSGNIVSVFLGKQSGMCLKRQSWREPICTSPLLPGLVLPTLTCLKVTWVALRCFSLSTAADQPLIWPFLQTPTCPVVLPGGWPEDNAMHFLCFLSAWSMLHTGGSSPCFQHIMCPLRVSEPGSDRPLQATICQ